MSNQITPYKAPKLDELVSMTADLSKENELQVLLNSAPPEKWIQVNQLANGSKYIPIDKIEYLLTRLFVKWWVEVLEYKIIANSCAVHVRLYYTSPITGETLHQDGLGAAPMQTDKGAGAIDFNQIKNAAVQMALPAAETYAVKDAAEKIGRIFGKDLNRKDLMNYEGLSGRFTNTLSDSDITIISEQLNQLHDQDEIQKYWNQLDAETVKDSRVIKLFNSKIQNFNANTRSANGRTATSSGVK